MSRDGIPSGEEDAALVYRVRDGDTEAFEQLVRRHLAVAHRVALGKTGNHHDAEDVCQDAFIRALTRIEDCRKPERFRSWFLTIVKNTAINRQEWESRRQGVPLSAVGGLGGGSDPGRALERSALRDDLGSAVEELPEMQRKVLLLHDYEGWTHGEIGEELGIAAGTSRFHLHQARERMRQMLGSVRETNGEDR